MATFNQGKPETDSPDSSSKKELQNMIFVTVVQRYFGSLQNNKQWQDLTDQQTESSPPWMPHNLPGHLLLG